MDTDEFSDKNVEAMERFPVDGAFHDAQGIPLVLTAIFTSRIFCGISQSKKVSLSKIIASNIYVNKRDRQLEENIGKCG